MEAAPRVKPRRCSMHTVVSEPDAPELNPAQAGNHGTKYRGPSAVSSQSHPDTTNPERARVAERLDDRNGVRVLGANRQKRSKHELQQPADETGNEGDSNQVDPKEHQLEYNSEHQEWAGI